MAGTITRIGPMTTGADYFQEQIKYHEEQFVAVARERFPQYSNLTDTELMRNEEVNKALQEDPMAPKWSGDIAKLFGLQGKVVDYGTWEKVCAGYAPNANLLDNPQTLNNNPLPIEVVIDEHGNPKAKIVEKEGKRVGTELIFANGKPYSVLCGAAEGEQLKQLVEAKNRCIAKVMKDVEQLGYYRKQENGVKTKQRANGIMWVAYNHIDNRGATKDEDPSMTTQEVVSNLAEPHDHSHIILLGTTQDKDGNLVALDNDLILKEKDLLSAKYEMYMAEELKALGYETKPQHIKGQADNEYMDDWEKGVMVEVPVLGELEDELVDRFSQRSKQIHANGDGIKAREINQANKNHKTRETNSQLKARWRAEASQLDPRLTPDYFKNLQGRSPVQPRNLEQLTSIPNWEERLIDSFYDKHKEIACREGHFKAHVGKILHQFTDTETALQMAEAIFAKRFVGYLDPKQQEKYDKLLEKGNLNLLELESMQIELERDMVYIDKAQAEAETKTVEKFKERANELNFMLPHEVVDRVIADLEAEQGYEFRDEQRQAVYNFTLKSGAYALLAGRAGSGKTTISKAVVRAYEMMGYRVIGLGTSGKNTKNLLAEAGIKEGYNTAQFIQGVKSGKIKDINQKTILICDEMGMADGRTWTKLCEIVNASGAAAKFMGESEQMTAIGASGLFRVFEKLGLNTSKLKHINRQKLNYQKEATEMLASGQGDMALQTYSDNGHIITHNKTTTESEAEIGERIIFKNGSIRIDDKRAIEMKDGDEAIVQAIDDEKKTMTLLLGKREVIAVETINVKTLKDGIEVEETKEVPVYKTTHFNVVVPLEQSIQYEKQTSIKTLDEANRIAADLFLKVPPNKTRLIETDTNANCSAINDLIKQGLKAQGKQGDDLITVKTKEYGDRAMAIGDQVIFREKLQLFGDGTIRPVKGNSRKPAVAVIENGETATVFSVDTEQQLITFKMNDGSYKSVKFDREVAINHAYAVSVFSSQGQSIDDVFQVPTRAGSLNESYVAASRHKENFTMILNDELAAQIDKTLDDNPPNEKMVDYAKSIAEQKGLEYTEEMEYSFKKTREFLNAYSNKEITEKDRNGKPIKHKAPHPLDRYKDFMAYCLQLQVKKTSFDYTVASDLLKEVLEGVKQLPEKYIKQVQELAQQQPASQVKQPSQDAAQQQQRDKALVK